MVSVEGEVKEVNKKRGIKRRSKKGGKKDKEDGEEDKEGKEEEKR
jgi:hypothetical protein